MTKFNLTEFYDLIKEICFLDLMSPAAVSFQGMSPDRSSKLLGKVRMFVYFGVQNHYYN